MSAPAGQSLTEVYLEQREALARFIRARLGPAAEVEDLLQDLFLKVSATPEDGSIREPRAWLYRLTSNLMMDRWRSGRRAAARDGAWRMANHVTDGPEDIADMPSAEAVVAGREQLAAVVAALERLPSKTAVIFRMHKFDGLGYAEVAARLGVSRSSVEKHMMEALKVLAARVPR